MASMLATVFVEKGKIALREVPRPTPGPGEALIKVTLTTICGTDVHIVRGEYPVDRGRILGHEPVGLIEELGAGVQGSARGDRALSAPSRPVASAARAFRTMGHNAITGATAFALSADGASVTPSTDAKRSMW